MRISDWSSDVCSSDLSSHVKDGRLRQALSFHSLLVGGNPMTTSAIYALIHMIGKQGGLWWARGGTNALVAGLVRLFERLGGTLRLGDPVTAIATRGSRTTGVDRTSVVEGKGGSVRVDIGGR